MSRKQVNLWRRHWEERNDKVFDYDEEALILASQFKEIGAKFVLSLGCGTGPLLRRLAEYGFEGTGVDRDKSLLNFGEKLARQQGHSIRFICADIRRLPKLGMFDAAFAMHLSFSVKDWTKILRCLRPLLKPGGIFLAGFVYADPKTPKGTKGVSADLLTLSSRKTLVEVDCYIVEETWYQCSMILIEERVSDICCNRYSTRIHFFSKKAEIINLLRPNGYTDPIELREENIGFPGLKATLIKTVSL
jgi:SAM-dependent methyltransferase